MFRAKIFDIQLWNTLEPTKSFQVVLWMTVPQHHPSLTCRTTKPTVTTQPSLLSVCAGILSSQANGLAVAKHWKQDDSLSTGCLVFLPWTWRELLDAQMVSWPQELPVICWDIFALPPLPTWSCGVVQAATGPTKQPRCCPTSQKPF